MIGLRHVRHCAEWVRSTTCVGSEAARAATRSTPAEAAGRAGGWRSRAALGLVGVLVFVAFQLLSGGSGFAVPTAFDDGAQAPDGGAIPAGQDPERDLRDFSEYVFDSRAEHLVAHVRRRLPRRQALPLPRRRLDGLRLGELGGRPVLLPGRRARVPGPAASSATWSASSGRPATSLGVRDRARGRPPRAAPARHQRRGPPPAALGPGPGERALRPARAAGRLLRGRVGALGLRPARRGRRRGGDQGLGGRRRRPPPAPRDAARCARTRSPTGPRAQRAKWFKTGQSAGEPADCDTFSVDEV